MSHRALFRLALAFASMGTALGSGEVFAQQGAPRQPAQVARNPRPPQPGANGPAQVQISPELEQILQIWEQHTDKIERMQGVFRRYEYNKVFQIEKRAIGKYWYERPDKARMDFQPDPEIPDPPTHVIGQMTFTVQPDETKSWICTGQEILDIEIKNKQFNRVQIPVSFQGENIRNGPLPFLFGMKADQVKEKYLLSLGADHAPQEKGIIHIVAYPLAPSLRREFSRAEVRLDARTFYPEGVKLWDPAGNKETVYAFYKPEVNKFQIWGRSPFKVNLRGYTLLEDLKAPPEDNPQSNIRGVRNGPGGSRSASGNSGILVK